MNLYIGDLHFGHKSVIGFDHRPFGDVEEMDRTLIAMWNGRVQKDDDIYIVGDFAFRNERPEEWYLKQLRGRKHLIIGNHDHRLLNNEKAMAYFDSVDKMMHVSDERNQICICHFPIIEWNGFHKGHWHIYAHIHNRTDDTFEFMIKRERALNAGCMINHYIPVSFNELVKNNREFQMEMIKNKENDIKMDEDLKKKYHGCYIPTFDEQYGIWVVDTTNGVEYGDASYVAAEFCGRNVIYPFDKMNSSDCRNRDHEHDFDAVIEKVLENPVAFSVEQYKEYYSHQELEVLDCLQRRLALVYERNCLLSREEKRKRELSL